MLLLFRDAGNGNYLHSIKLVTINVSPRLLSGRNRAELDPQRPDRVVHVLRWPRHRQLPLDVHG